MNSENLSLLLSYVIPYVLLYLAYRNTSHKKVFSTIENMIIIQFLVWKLSYILVSFDAVMSHPMSILYYMGGTIGLILSIAITFIYGFYHMKKENKNTCSFTLIVLQTIALCVSMYMFFHDKTMLPSVLLVVAGFLYFYVSNKKITLQNILLTCIGCLLVFTIFNNTVGKQSTPNVVNHSDFTSKTYEIIGETDLHNLSEKTIVLNFFATWCPPCKAELPELMKFYNEEKDNKAVEFIAVNATSTESSKKKVYKFLDKEKVLFPVLLDETDYLVDYFKVTTFPTTIVINKKGEIIKQHQGPITANLLHSLTKKD